MCGHRDRAFARRREEGERLARAFRDAAGARLDPARINGLPGFILTEPDGAVTMIALETEGEKITAVYAVRNPEKLRHIVH